MKKIIIFLFYFVLSLISYSQEKIDLWPIKNTNGERGILYKPQDYIENELNFDNLFITANESEVVVAPHSGIIKSLFYTYSKSLIYMNSFRHIYNDSLSTKEFDIEFRKAVAKYNKLDPKYISVSIGLQTKKDEIYYISGLRPFQYFKTGSKIEKGQVIGYVGYSYKKINKPSIWFSRSVNGKVADPMSIFGIKSTFIPYKKNKIDYLKYKHPIDNLKKDFIVLRESLEEGHPGIYDYTTKLEMNKIFNQTYERYTKPLTSEEFRISLLPILRAIKDSHTAIYSNKYRLTDKSKLPLLFGLQNDSLIVYSTTSDYTHLLHKRISKINNESIENIISKIKRISYGNDGYVESHDKRMLLLYFGSLYKKIYQFKKSDKVEIQFADRSSSTFNYDFYEPEKYLPKLKSSSKKRFSLKRLNSGVGVVDLNTFQLLETDIDSIGVFIANPTLEHLIIDVRDNSGGDIDAIKRIFSFIAKKPFRISSYEMVNKRDGYNFFKNSLNYLPDSKLFENYKKVENKNGYYFPDENIPTIEPNKEQHFDKDIYVLTNEFSKSASTVFPALVYKHKRGTIIGRETGSSYYQLNAKKFVQIYLKNTGLELYMPLVKSVFDTKGNSDIPWGRGVLPDNEIQISFNEFIDDSNDTFIDATIEIIENNKQKINKGNNRTYLIIGSFLTLLLLVFVILSIRKKIINYR
jgi:C-terminal processing protease CtpA/Prc